MLIYMSILVLAYNNELGIQSNNKSSKIIPSKTFALAPISLDIIAWGVELN